MVVGVDQHGAQVADDGGWMWWLEHLPHVAGMKEGVVVPQSPVQIVRGFPKLREGDVQGWVWLVMPVFGHPRADGADCVAEQVGQVGKSGWSGVQNLGGHPIRSIHAHRK